MALAKSQRSLRAWTKQDWGTKSGKPSGETGERYLPKAAREALSPAEYAATTAKKREDTAKGKQFSKQPEKTARKVRQFRRVGKQEGGDLNLFDYQAPTPEEILQAGGTRNIVEPTTPTPIRDALSNILNPSGKKLFSFIDDELNNPVNYLGGGPPARVASNVVGRGVAKIGHNKGPSLLDNKTGSIVSDDVANKIFDIDQDMDNLYDLRRRQQRVGDKYTDEGFYGNPKLSQKELNLLDKEWDYLDNTIKDLERKTLKKIQKRYETNIASRTIPELNPRNVSRPSVDTLANAAIGKTNKDIIKNVDTIIDSPGFDEVFQSTYGGTKFSGQLHRLFNNADKSIDDLDYLSTYTDLKMGDYMTKVTPEGVENLNPLEIYEAGLNIPVTFKLGSKANPFFVNPKKLADKLDRSDAGKDFFKLETRDIDYIDNLETSIKKYGYDPNPIQIEIKPSGNTVIFEGNHRLYRALARGENEVPVTFQYLAGAERLDTPFGINELDSFVAQGEKGYKSPKEIKEYIKEIDKFYKKK